MTIRGTLHEEKRIRQAYDEIKRWHEEQGRTIQGDSIASIHWKHIFQALSLMLQKGIYPEQEALRDALKELMKPFPYDEKLWDNEHLIRFTEGNERKMNIFLLINPIFPNK